MTERPGGTLSTEHPDETTPAGRAAETDADHAASPAEGTMFREGSLPADPRYADHYPVDAMCSGCGQPVRAPRYGEPFRHTGRRPGDPR